MLPRNRYLINRAFLSFLCATLLASMASSLAVTVDGVIVGRLLGARPLAALGLVSPVAQIFNALGALVNTGGALLVSLCIGRRHADEAGALFTTSVILSLAIGSLGILAAVFALPGLSGLLTHDPALRPLVEEYLRIMLYSTPVYLLLPGLCVFIRTDSAARLASMALVLGNLANLGLDILLIRGFRMGLAGSSLATTLGYLLGIVVAALYFAPGRRRVLSLRLPDFRLTPRLIVAGAPIALASLLMCARIYCTNAFVQTFLTSARMPLMAACFNLLMIASMVIAGISQSLQPLGGILRGLEDPRGLRMAVQNAWRLLLACLVLLAVLMLIRPDACLAFFGLDAPPDAIRALRLFTLSIPLYGANYLLMVTHQTMGRTRLALLNSIADSLLVIAALFALARWRPDALWAGFALGESLVLLLVLLTALATRRRDPDPGASPLLRLPPERPDTADFSTRGDLADLTLAMTRVADFLCGQHHPDATSHVQHCCEELLAAYAETAPSRSKYVDILIHREPRRLVLCIVSAGAPLDLARQRQGTLNEILCRKMSDHIQYAYIANQNVTTFHFDLP